MKINTKVLCIPPYISVTWDQVALVQTETDEMTGGMNLLLHMIDGKLVTIPNLDSSIIDIVFQSHLKHLEEAGVTALKRSEGNKSPVGFLQQIFGMASDQLGGMPIRFGINGPNGMEGIEMAMQHNPAQEEAEDMPKEMLEKIASFTKMMMGGDLSQFPKPEPHCNCHHCQVARSIHGIEKRGSSEIDEPVSNEDLTFKEWDIVQCGDKYYKVTNPLDSRESYNVHLATPIGCTCGNPHCEHIKAVLSS